LPLKISLVLYRTLITTGKIVVLEIVEHRATHPVNQQNFRADICAEMK